MRTAAAVPGMSSTTADCHWAYARAWLYNELRPEEQPGLGILFTRVG